MKQREAVMVYLMKEHSLLLLHTDYPIGLVWNGVSGFVDEGETAVTAAIREVQEEIGVTIKAEDLIETNQVILGNIPFTVFVTTAWEGEPAPLEDCTHELHWFPVNDLPYANMHEGTRDWILKSLDKTNPTIDSRIPASYQALWKPFEYDGVLYHLTTKENLELIHNVGYLEPRDPYPRPWGGMTAIYMACPEDPLYEETLPHVLTHVKKKHEHVLRLQIKTNNSLYKSLDPERTFQVLSLDPISTRDIIGVEEV